MLRIQAPDRAGIIAAQGRVRRLRVLRLKPLLDGPVDGRCARVLVEGVSHVVEQREERVVVSCRGLRLGDGGADVFFGGRVVEEAIVSAVDHQVGAADLPACLRGRPNVAD